MVIDETWVDTSPGGLLHLLRTGRAATRADLVRLTGLSRGAVTARVGALASAGLLLEGADLASTGGRPAAALRLDPDAGVVLAVAVGRSRSQVGVFDLAGREVAGDTRDHEPGTGARDLMPDVAARLDSLLDGLVAPSAPRARVLGVGLSLPGSVDPASVTATDAPVMRGWDGVALAPYLSPVTDAPVHLDNDTSVLVRSELFGRVPVARDMLVL